MSVVCCQVEGLCATGRSLVRRVPPTVVCLECGCGGGGPGRWCCSAMENNSVLINGLCAIMWLSVCSYTQCAAVSFGTFGPRTFIRVYFCKVKKTAYL